MFYDTMLREMRDAAGDAGEFYTLRPVVRFIIDRLAPQLGERVLDPACGTCGFLVETYERLRSEVRTPEQLADDILRKEQEILEIMAGIKQALGAHAIAEGSSKGDQKSCRGIRKR